MGMGGVKVTITRIPQRPHNLVYPYIHVYPLLQFFKTTKKFKQGLSLYPAPLADTPDSGITAEGGTKKEPA